MTSHAALIAGSALFLSLACNSGKPDTSRVIANVGGDKITEAEFQDVVKTLSQDPKEAQSFLSDPAARGERANLASRIAMSKAIATYAKQTGLDQDPAVKRQLEQQEANVYFQALAKKRMPTAEPTDEQLMAFYKEQVDRMKAQGASGAVPPFETVKAQVAQGYKQQQAQAISLDIQKEIKAKVPITLADDYRPAGE
jgi:soluble lytic murein transglycosylase-like protein